MKDIFVNTTGGVVSVNLPAGVAGAVVAVKDYAGTFNTNAITLVQNGSDKIGGSTDNKILNTKGIAATLIFIDSTQGWLVTDDGLQSIAKAPNYTAEYLVIAAGASGGCGNSGGGGAGGMLTNFGGTAITLAAGVTYTATIGQGGAAVSGSPRVAGNDGGDSVLSGTGITTVTATGGGGGGSNTPAVRDGRDGGSGGGGNYLGSGGSGTSPQGNDGGDGAGNVGPQYGAGGGGGAGAAGSNGTSSAGGAGGNGLANSITGSAVTYAGGGGGSANSSGTAAGGSGGGGAGSNGSGSVSGSGTANLGAGGGGTHDGTSGAGGSGVIILTMADDNYSGNVTGGPTVVTGVSGKTVVTFTGTGTYVG